MLRRGMKAKALAAKVGISQASMSHILTSRSIPRSSTYKRILAGLAPTSQELAALNQTTNLGQAPQLQNPSENRRTSKLGEGRALLSHSVSSIFVDLGIRFQQGPASKAFDFLLSTKPGIGVLIAFPSVENWSQMFGQALIERESLPSVKFVVVVCGFVDPVVAEYEPVFRKHGVYVAYEPSLRQTLVSLTTAHFRT
jgi:hypothetical protein